MSKLATIYRRKGVLFVTTSHKTEAGFWVADRETSVVGPSNMVDIEKTIVESLARSQSGIPTPKPDADLVGSLLLAAGVSSWGTFSRLAQCVDVRLEDGRLQITPYRNLGGRDGFAPITDKAVEISEGAPDLGKAVLAALEVADDS